MRQSIELLTGEGVTLIPLTEAHANVYMQLANEPSIAERINNPIPYTRELFDTLLADIAAKERYFVWLIEHEGVVCGAINSASQGHKAKFQGGYWLDPAFRGKGLAAKSLALVNRFLFEKLQAQRIQAVVEPDNTPSIRVLETAGFHCEGVLKRYYPTRRRGLVDVCMYAIMKEGIE